MWKTGNLMVRQPVQFGRTEIHRSQKKKPHNPQVSFGERGVKEKRADCVRQVNLERSKGALKGKQKRNQDQGIRVGAKSAT